MRHLYLFLTLASVVITTASLEAKNVDLSTVPDRDTVQLTIYNSEDITLVRETRIISFKTGSNPLQFSWANTLIDPTSVQLRFLTQPDKLEVLDTTFPHDKPQMLYWNVESEIDGEATIEITYFTSGLRWSADYVLVADQSESQVGFEGFVRVYNESGEEYENAQVRLVVGKINLVEKIAQLASVPMDAVAEMTHDKKWSFQVEAARRFLQVPASNAPAESSEVAAKEVIKEGLSEYFIYTIDGTETIANGWSKRMRSLKPVDVPLKIQHRYREPEYGPQLVRLYLMRNDIASKLGTTPLPDGVVRVFRNNGRDGLSFLAEQSIDYIAIGDKIELNLGPDPEVLFELVKLKVWRDTVWMRIGGANVYRRVDEPGVQIEVRSTVAGWDEHAIFTQRVRNYSGKPIDLEVRRSFDGHAVFRSQLTTSEHDYRTVQYTALVAPGEQADLIYELLVHQGHNAKQNNLTLEESEVSPQ